MQKKFLSCLDSDAVLFWLKMQKSVRLVFYIVFRDPMVSSHLPLMHSSSNTIFALAFRTVFIWLLSLCYPKHPTEEQGHTTDTVNTKRELLYIFKVYFFTRETQLPWSFVVNKHPVLPSQGFVATLCQTPMYLQLHKCATGLPSTCRPICTSQSHDGLKSTVKHIFFLSFYISKTLLDTCAATTTPFKQFDPKVNVVEP